MKEVKGMQGREIMILRSSIAALKQYNQYLLKRNEVLEDLVKKYAKFLEDLQNNLKQFTYKEKRVLFTAPFLIPFTNIVF